jgi:hypothetical protein
VRIGLADSTTVARSAYFDLKNGFVSVLGIAENSPCALTSAWASLLVSVIVIVLSGGYIVAHPLIDSLLNYMLLEVISPVVEPVARLAVAR